MCIPMLSFRWFEYMSVLFIATRSLDILYNTVFQCFSLKSANHVVHAYIWIISRRCTCMSLLR